MPLGIASDGANRHDSKLLEPTIAPAEQQLGALPAKAGIHLDSAYARKVRANPDTAAAQLHGRHHRAGVR